MAGSSPCAADYRAGEVSSKAIRRGLALVVDYGATILLVPIALLGLVCRCHPTRLYESGPTHPTRLTMNQGLATLTSCMNQGLPTPPLLSLYQPVAVPPCLWVWGLAKLKKNGILRVLKECWTPQLILKNSQLFKT